MSILEAVELAKTYRGGDGAAIEVLDGLNLTVERGEIVAIVGASGAGKSTLLHLLGGLDYPTRGIVTIGGEPLVAARAELDAVPTRTSNGRGRRKVAAKEGVADDPLSAHRNKSLGFVSPFHHPLPQFSPPHNVIIPLRFPRPRSSP